MNRAQSKKLFVVIGLIIVLGVAAALVLYALKQNINLFYTPTQLQTAVVNPTQLIRVGGFVKTSSVKYAASGKVMRFVLMDDKNEMVVNYDGVLPGLFREGQGVVVTGRLSGATLSAVEVLAKHDEKYKPKWSLINQAQTQ